MRCSLNVCRLFITPYVLYFVKMQLGTSPAMRLHPVLLLDVWFASFIHLFVMTLHFALYALLKLF